VKNTTFALLCVLIFSATSSAALASDVSACANDASTRADIESVKVADANDTQFNVIRNLKGEVVGVLVSDKAGKLYSTYLCGSNPGYYYTNGQISELKAGLPLIYNDEYDMKVLKFAYDENTNTSKFTVKIAFNGSEADADYSKFQTTFVINVEPTSEVPWTVNK
jgi:hypothetical protein